jgi:hypothetical protein
MKMKKKNKLEKQKNKKKYVEAIKKNPSLIEKDFKYLEDLNNKELKNIKDNYIVIDPGKRTILQMFNHKKTNF